MRKKRRASEEEPNTKGWLETYSDTITLILAFFVMLYSISIVDQQSFSQISVAFNKVFEGSQSDSIFDYNDAGDSIIPKGDGEFDILDEIEKQEQKQRVLDQLEEQIEEQGFEGDIMVVDDPQGFAFVLEEQLLFESGKADLKKQSLAALAVVADLIGEIPNEIIIEGHTDDVPIHNWEFKDNIALGSARANAVGRYFIESGLDPTRFHFVSFGEFRPVKENNSDANRAKNRRVNIIVVTEY